MPSAHAASRDFADQLYLIAFSLSRQASEIAVGNCMRPLRHQRLCEKQSHAKALVTQSKTRLFTLMITFNPKRLEQFAIECKEPTDA
jgi:hypothetical protein